MVTHDLATLSANDINCNNIPAIMGICKTISPSYHHTTNECFSKFQSDFINDLMMETSSYNFNMHYWIGLNQRRGGMYTFGTLGTFGSVSKFSRRLTVTYPEFSYFFCLTRRTFCPSNITFADTFETSKLLCDTSKINIKNTLTHLIMLNCFIMWGDYSNLKRVVATESVYCDNVQCRIMYNETKVN